MPEIITTRLREAVQDARGNGVSTQALNSEEERPLYFLTTQPRAWLRASLPKLKAQLNMASSDHNADQNLALVLEQQASRWEDQTGEKPADSHFTIVVPIHNEQHALPSFLGTLQLSDIPPQVNMQVVFVTNACRDASAQIIEEFLAQVSATNVSNFTYRYIDTATPGKANALTHGNELALARGDKIAMCFDADVYLEPDAIRLLYAKAHQTIKDDSNTVVVSGVPNQTAQSLSLLREYWRKIRPPISPKGRLSPIYGMSMAWNTGWIEEIGGVPAQANEDYAMSVEARLKGCKVDWAEDSHVWQYRPTNLRDLFEEQARMARCVRQVINRSPEAKEITEKDGYSFSLAAAFSPYLKNMKERPLFTPFFILRGLLRWAAFMKGTWDYYKDPNNQSWVPIKSTK